jgi:hypothetical protein
MYHERHFLEIKIVIECCEYKFIFVSSFGGTPLEHQIINQMDYLFNQPTPSNNRRDWLKQFNIAKTMN